MKTNDDRSVPVDDPAQLTIEPTDPEEKYLGNYKVTQKLFSEFARSVVIAYDAFLRGTTKPEQAEAEVTALVKRYADIFMERSTEYEPAPWHSEYKIGGRIRAWIPGIGGNDPGEAYFSFLADQCLQATKAMVVDGMLDEEAGLRLGEIIEDGVNRFMYVTR